MKFGIWLLILSVALAPAYPNFTWIPTAQAEGPQNNNSDCTSSTAGYGGGSLTHCNTTDSQETSQKDTEKLNDSGSQQSSMMGTMAIGAGMAMIAAGMACSPSPCTGLIAAGAALVMAGMQALSAASKMANNSGISGYNAGNLGSISGLDPVKTNLGKNGPGASIKIDPNLTRDGKVGMIFDDFEQKTGISREELAEALAAGKSPSEIMAAAGKFGSQDQLDKILADNAAAGSAMTQDELMNKLGLAPEYMLVASTADESAYSAASVGASRSPSSTTNGLDGLLGAKADPNAGVFGNKLGLSPDVQAALDRNGITSRSIFQMVSDQYKRKTPMLFGVPARQPSSHGVENPFANLDGKVEL